MKLTDIVHSGTQESWAERNKDAFNELFGTPHGRYPQSAKDTVSLRTPEMKTGEGVAFAAYIHPSNPKSGPYSGLSFVIFPASYQPCLLGMVVGTQGLVPDEGILGRPGHARKVQAICAWLNSRYGDGKLIAWAKQDPTRTDLQIPNEIGNRWPAAYKNAFDRYGKEMYALFCPTEDRAATDAAISAFLDLLFEERGQMPLTNYREDSESIRAEWFEFLMPTVSRVQVRQLLIDRRFGIIQGPPGTGKTKMATDLLQHDYGGFGRSIQFHPNTSYESFIGGLAPIDSNDQLGLRFKPTPGFLMEAARVAASEPSRDYLLHIDEINRADLGKILGEAIFLLEPKSAERSIDLPYDFGEPFHRKLSLPKNLHIRRRFSFVSLWPSMKVVSDLGCKTMQDAFSSLLSIFVEHATADTFSLVPGHSYFLELEENKAKESLGVSLAPLLEEYLAQGYVGGFAEPIRSYLQWLRSL